MDEHEFVEKPRNGYPICVACGLSRPAHDEEQRLLRARREGVIEGLEWALRAECEGDLDLLTFKIRAEIERLRGEK